LVAEVLVIAAGTATTVLSTKFKLEKLVVHAKFTVAGVLAPLFAPVRAPEEIAVTVILVEPAVVNPEAVKLPLPATETVIVAVEPVVGGDEILYVTL
jgi:hypothetical protein